MCSLEVDWKIAFTEKKKKSFITALKEGKKTIKGGRET